MQDAYTVPCHPGLPLKKHKRGEDKHAVQILEMGSARFPGFYQTQFLHMSPGLFWTLDFGVPVYWC